MFAITLKEMNEMHSLEKVLAIFKAEKGDSVGHHPNVASAAVVVRLVPLAVLITDSENLFLIHLEERVIDNSLVET